MKRFLLLAVVFVLMGCGADVVVGSAGTTPEPTSSAVPATPAPVDPTASPTPDDQPTGPLGSTEQREALAAARVRWQLSRPDSYSITYRQECECDQGPWRVVVDSSGGAIAAHLFPGPGAANAPYHSVEQIFGEIESVLDGGRFPVDVEYDEAWGFPRNYIFNEPELAIDGGFILVVEDFIANPEPDTERDDDRAALAAAVARWAQAGLDDYDYNFVNSCFCPPEYVGPHAVSVRDGAVVGATFEGVDVRDVESLNIDDYSDLVKTVDQVFDEIGRAIDEAASYTVEYHPELGYPTAIFVDWDERVADEEGGYGITDLGSPSNLCSTSGVDVRLVPQPDLPDNVERRRQAIFDAAMACDIDALVALTNADGFSASFGGGDAAELWRESEARSEPILLDLVQHLNLAYAVSGEGAEAIYTWPSAFTSLEASDGTGLSAAEYEQLLELYSVEELESMFAGIGSYVGYRVGIDAGGSWLFFIAGD